jgi:hypothetical protein
MSSNTGLWMAGGVEAHDVFAWHTLLAYVGVSCKHTTKLKRTPSGVSPLRLLQVLTRPLVQEGEEAIPRIISTMQVSQQVASWLRCRQLDTAHQQVPHDDSWWPVMCGHALCWFSGSLRLRQPTSPEFLEALQAIDAFCCNTCVVAPL